MLKINLRIFLGLPVMIGALGCEVDRGIDAKTGDLQAAIIGPDATVAVRGDRQLSVSWTAATGAIQYQIFQSAGAGSLELQANVFDSGGGAPATSWIAEHLTAGVRYCYAVRALLPDGSLTDRGAPRCEIALGTSANATGTMFIPPLEFRCVLGCPNDAGLVNGRYFGSFDPAGGVWRSTSVGGAFELDAPLVVPPGTTVSKIEAFFRRSSDLGPDDQYTMHLVSRTLIVGAPVANQVDMVSSVRGSDPGHFPGLDSMTLSGLPITTADSTVYVITWKGFAPDAGGLPNGPDHAFYGVAVTLGDVAN